MSTLRMGDANNDNCTPPFDFNILRNSFGKTYGQPGFDDRADFTGYQRVTTVDFNLLKGNFGQGGAQAISPLR